jgi:hypothetical protein
MMPDSLAVFDRERQPTHALRDMLAGRPAFLIGGGPSANSFDMSQLQRRGLWSMAVNNVAGHFRVNSFVCSDPPSKFHDLIWRDPSVMKFVPLPKLTNRGRGQIRTKIDGVVQPLLKSNGQPMTTADCPNVWGFARRSWWAYDDTFFSEDHATWGNGNDGVLRTKNEKVFCTLLLAMRLLYYLGSRRIFLVGVDFMMTDTGYSFGQGRTSKAVSNNNAQYRVVNDGLCTMAKAGVFKRAGFDIFNCNQNSGLRAFPYVPFDDAVKVSLKDFPTDHSLDGWYEKGENK